VSPVSARHERDRIGTPSRSWQSATVFEQLQGVIKRVVYCNLRVRIRTSLYRNQIMVARDQVESRIINVVAGLVSVRFDGQMAGNDILRSPLEPYELDAGLSFEDVGTSETMVGDLHSEAHFYTLLNPVFPVPSNQLP
jgi:hypothetical protein